MTESPKQPNTVTPESFDVAAWEKLKQGGAALAASIINKGRELGVSAEELNQFAQEAIAQWVTNQQYDVIYRFRKNMKIGSAEEIKAAGDLAYQFFIEIGESGLAMRLAEDVYGKDSIEWQRANEANEAEWKKRKKKMPIVISATATFADLFAAMDAAAIEEFTNELEHNFDTDVAYEVNDFRTVAAKWSDPTTVLDFFKKHGYPQHAVTAYLPIKFKQEKKD